jgi:hypothetical protein
LRGTRTDILEKIPGVAGDDLPALPVSRPVLWIGVMSSRSILDGFYHQRKPIDPEQPALETRPIRSVEGAGSSSLTLNSKK